MSTKNEKLLITVEVAKSNIDETTKEIVRLKSEIAKTKSEQKKATKEYKDGAISQKEYKNVILKTTKELSNNNVQLRKENQTLKLNQRYVNSVTDSYDRLSAELTMLRREQKSGNTMTTQQIQRIKTLDKQLKHADKNMGNFQRNVGNYRDALKGLGTVVTGVTMGVTAVVMALGRVKQKTDEYIEAYNDQFLAEKKLAVIMKERADATDQQIQSVIELTQVQQENGVVGDEVQLAGAQQLQTFLHSTDAVKTLIPAMNNLIAQQKGVNGTQQDAITIANMMGKVMDGQVSALTRVGISLTDHQKELLKTGTEQEKVAMLAEVIKNNVGDMNKELSLTDAGKIQQAKNELGDMREEIGEKLIPVMAELGTLSVTFMKSLGDTEILSNFAENIGYITDVLKWFNKTTEESNKKTTFFTRVIDSLVEAVKTTINPLGHMIAQIKDVMKWLGIIKKQTNNNAIKNDNLFFSEFTDKNFNEQLEKAKILTKKQYKEIEKKKKELANKNKYKGNNKESDNTKESDNSLENDLNFDQKVLDLKLVKYDEFLNKKLEYQEAYNKNSEKLSESDMKRQEAMMNNISNIAMQAGEMLGQLATDSEATAKDYAKAMLVMTLEAVKNTILIYEGEILAKQVAENGFVGIITSSFLIGLTQATFAGIESKVKGFANGGIITGGVPIQRANGDDTLITAKKGEAILNEKQQSIIGVNNLRLAGVQGFAEGGIISSGMRSAISQQPKTNTVLVVRDLENIQNQQINEIKYSKI